MLGRTITRWCGPEPPHAIVYDTMLQIWLPEVALVSRLNSTNAYCKSFLWLRGNDATWAHSTRSPQLEMLHWGDANTCRDRIRFIGSPGLWKPHSRSASKTGCGSSKASRDKSLSKISFRCKPPHDQHSLLCLPKFTLHFPDHPQGPGFTWSNFESGRFHL